jgi:serine protease Do
MQMKFKSLLIWPLALISLGAANHSTPAPARGVEVLSQVSHELNQIAKQATPAVVSITSVHSPLMPAAPLGNPGGVPPEFAEQFALGVGSGVIIRPDGLILTNLHVVQNADKITIVFDDNRKAGAHLRGGDSKTDLAVLQLDHPPQNPLPTLTFGNSTQLNVGDWIIAVGSPFGLNHTVTSGIISAVGRGQLGMLDIEDFIQTDAPINPGNSGGPLLNSHGEIIGINTAIFSQTGGFTGVGLAIPSQIARQVFDGIVQHGHVIRGWIGVIAQDLDSQLAEYFKAPNPEGALISQVQNRGPASKAKLRSGDVVTHFGNQTVHSANQLKSLVANAPVSKEIRVSICRNGKTFQVPVYVQEQPEVKSNLSNQKAGQAAHVAQRPATHGNLGVAVQDLTPELAKLLKASPYTGAIVAEVQPGSPAFDVGLSVGDVIVSANQSEVHNAKELSELFDQMKKDEIAVLYVQKSPDEKVFVPMKRVK